MNTATKKLGLFIRDLLNYDEQLIIRGRHNFERDDFSTNYIVVDAVAQSLLAGKSQKYDDVNEKMTYWSLFNTPCTINFYGDEKAYQRAVNFQNLISSEKSLDLQRKLNLAVYQITSITDVKALTGQQYGERIELALTVNHTESTEVETLRIDEPVFKFLFNK
jgi:hypothetical protein